MTCASAIRRSNPELLDALGQKFQEYHYDFRQLVRDICTSRTYQLASETNESNAGDDRNFSHARSGGCARKCCAIACRR